MSTLEQIKWINLKTVNDDRGALTSIEGSLDIPLEIKRIFYMHNVIADRGGHAHKETDQLIIATSGSFIVDVFDGLKQKTYTFDDPTIGLYIPKLIFTTLRNFSHDAVCLVLANTHYDMSKSLRTMADYLSFIK